MARRASSATNPVWFIAVAVLIAGAIVIGWWLKSRVGDPFRTLTPLPLTEYLENSDSLRGNTYKLSGTIGEQLKYQPATRERLFEVNSASGPVSVLVPAEFNQLDLRKDQRFQFKIEVTDKGKLLARDVVKE